MAVWRPRSLAALGTSLELKSEFGEGYTLTLSRCQPLAASGASGGGNSAGDAPNSSGPAEAAGEEEGPELGGGGTPEPEAAPAALLDLTALVRQHVPKAQLLSATGT